MAGRRYEQRVAVVTGGASGIGRELVRALVAEGARVVVADRDADGVAARVAEHGGALRGVVGDISDGTTSEAMVRCAVDELGGLDVAFNAAGTSAVGSILELGEDAWDRTVDACLKGTFLAVQHEARQMVAQGRGGAIVNVASLNALVPNHGSVAYCSAKAGTLMLGRVAALELGEHGIRVNTLSPGLTDTPLARPLIDEPELHREFLARIPLGTHAEPADIARAALFLGSDDARYVSGENLVVDGGWSTAGYPDMRPWSARLAARVGRPGAADQGPEPGR